MLTNRDFTWRNGVAVKEYQKPIHELDYSTCIPYVVGYKTSQYKALAWFTVTSALRDAMAKIRPGLAYLADGELSEFLKEANQNGVNK